MPPNDTIVYIYSRFYAKIHAKNRARACARICQCWSRRMISCNAPSTLITSACGTRILILSASRTLTISSSVPCFSLVLSAFRVSDTHVYHKDLKFLLLNAYRESSELVKRSLEATNRTVRKARLQAPLVSWQVCSLVSAEL